MDTITSMISSCNIISRVYTDHGEKKLLCFLVNANGKLALAFVKNSNVCGFIYMKDVLQLGFHTV